MNLAVDSLPLHQDIYRTLDYSGLQLHGLSHRPLHRARLSLRGSGCRWQIELDHCTWDDGKPIRPSQYIEGLAQLTARHPRLRSYLKPRLKRIATGPNQIVLEFAKPVGRDLFNWPNWVPYRPGYLSWHWTLRKNKKGWALEKRDGQRGQVYLVASPEENEKLFDQGLIDFTADTAIPLETVDESVRRRDTRLFGVLVHLKNTSSDHVRAVHQALSSIQFSKEIETIFPTLRQPVAPERSTPRRLRLSYDAFYPNREICAQIARHLAQLEWSVELIEDNYYRPKAPGDAKFMILQRPMGDAALSALWMNGMPRAPLVQERIQAHLAQCESGEDFDLKWLSDAELAYPLFQVPSLCRARSAACNPLLEVFP